MPKSALSKKEPTITEELATSQTRTQVLKILDDYKLSELRSVFLKAAPDGCSLAAVTQAVNAIKAEIYKLGYEDESPVIEKINTALVFRPSTNPPRAPNP